MLPIAPESLKETLKEVNPYLQEHLASDFEDEFRRQCERPNRLERIPSVISLDGPETTLLKNLEVTQVPSFTTRAFDLRTDELCVNLAIEVEKLVVEGNYRVFGDEAQGVTEQEGNITFILDNITIGGLIPIYVVEDSFIANEDFTLSFAPTQITIKKSWTTNGKAETSETVETEIDHTLIKSFWPGLLDVMFYLMYRDIGGSIVEYSVTELFADEPEEMIAFSNKRIELANEHCGKILEKVKKIQNRDSIEVPDLNLRFKTENSATPSCISFKKGKLSNLLNVRRRKDFVLNRESDGTLLFSGGLEIREISLTFDDCSATHGNVDNQGSCKLEMYRTKLLFRASVRKVGESHQAKVESIKFSWVRDIDYDATNLDCLSSVYDDVRSYLLSYFQGEIVGKLTQHLEGIFGEVVKDSELGQLVLKE